MKGDRLYCPHCGKYSIDTQELYESRQDGRPTYIAPKKTHYVWRCPYCFYGGLINVNQVIVDNVLKIAKMKNNYKGTCLYKKFIYDFPLLQQKALYTLSTSILIEENKHDKNSGKKVN